ncbi:glucanotransferase [Clostridium acetobutylicum]|nr:glucanotransferase [Clostridium acetobutylicum]
MKKKLIIVVMIFVVIFSILINLRIRIKNSNTLSYGVFTGLQPKNINRLLSYKEVVIDASYYSKAQIDFLHKKGIKVYSYLNVGSLENFRPYYSDFKDIALDNYENWKDESWIDVSNPKWDNYVVNTLGKNLKDKGVDGFFLDNLDVYSKYKKDSMFIGLLNIIKGLNSSYNLPVISNGGVDFLETAENKKISLKSLIYGINIESVYTTVDFNNNKFIKNSRDDRDKKVKYLEKLKSKDILIYIVEYSRDTSLKKIIHNYYRNLGFKVYISNSLNLN